MLLTPVDRPFYWKTSPRLLFGLALVITLVFLFWHRADVQRLEHLNAQYQQELLPVEWPLYETHLLRMGQRQALNRLNAAYDSGNIEQLSRYLGSDAGFVQAIEANGKEYLPDDVLDHWRVSRQQFDEEQRKLGAEALGVDPQKFRPITFFTYSLINEGLVQFIGAIFFLLTAGLALELALGSGAVLGSYFLGGLIGAITYLLVHAGGTLPLSGTGPAAASVIGMFVAHFRAGPVKLLGRVSLTALILPVMWLAYLALQFWLDNLSVPALVAQITAFFTGPLCYLAYQRWFQHENETIEIAPQEENDADLLYREQLQQALDAIARMEFVDAQKRLRELVKQYPSDLRALAQLYQVEKLTPDSTTFDAVARRFFQLATHSEDGIWAALPVYRDYDKLSLEKRALDTETSLKLIMGFARIGEVKEAEKLMKALMARKATHALLPKAAHALSQAFDKLQDPARAAQYKEMAVQ